MLALRPGVVITLEPGIVLHSLPEYDWFYAFSVTSGEQFRLNRTSFWVLEKISDGMEWIRLRDNFLATFDISPQQGEVDLEELLNGLHEQKIIRRQGNEEDKL